MLKNNEKKSYKYMSYLSSFIRYNEFSVLITFTKDAQNYHLAFACTRLVIDLVTLSIIPGVSRICRKLCSILFRSISAFSIDVAYTIDILNVPTNENLMDSSPENEQAMR